ncbi:MAG: 3-hydroxyacyl-CoA dehydrogenase family protein [Bacteriovoracia bacterium]
MTTASWAVDLSHSPLADKIRFLEAHASENVLLDVTCFHATDLYARYPQLKATCSTLLSLNGKCELHSPEHFDAAAELLRERGFSAVRTTLTTPGFVVARTMATIINEAYFTLEEEVATAEDIDRAMLFGVNYPAGPIAWAKGREGVVRELLATLEGMTGDVRYRSSRLLK